MHRPRTRSSPAQLELAIGAPRPRVFTIPPSAPFLRTLIAALLDGRLVPGFSRSSDPLGLARATIYLPTQRACRLAHDLFLDVLGGEAALLPRLAPLGDLDDDELIFAQAAGLLAEGVLDVPEAIDGLERRLLLAQLILKWARSGDVQNPGTTPLVANTPAAALALAEALARLSDDMITRGVPWTRLNTLVPENLDEYWYLTLRFLNIARDFWPAILAERNLIEPAERRDRLIAAEAARLRAAGDGPVIAAGSTASMPATATLLRTIANLPHGAVVLPGLDMQLDEPSWQLIAGPHGDEGDASGPAQGHPQFAMHGFLAGMHLQRDEVVELAPPGRHGRERLVSEALRPAATTDLWPDRLRGQRIEEALAGMTVIAAANAEEEALAIALVLREAVETPEKTAALITPDRALARRVIAALTRWNVEVDDSGGDALADAPAGVFAQLAADAALGGLAPVTLLALLKHPLFRLGAYMQAHARSASVLERAVLRGPRPGAGTDGLARALESLRANQEALHRADPRANLRPDQLDSAAALVAGLKAALAPLEGPGRGPLPLAQFAQCHRQVLDALADDGAKGSALDGEDGAEVLELLDKIAASEGAASLRIAPDEYSEIFRAALSGLVVPRKSHARPRVRIFGVLEARLQQMDRVVLGGLVEGTWPPQIRPDPWLSRPMRQSLGLDLPERRIGLSAHDFAQALGTEEVFLTTADKIAGAPTVPSRFLHRLAAVSGTAAWDEARKRGQRYLAWARGLDRPVAVRRVAPPAPTPPVAARPSRLSVTAIEDWLRDPYTIYAKHILHLQPLDPVDTPPGARDRGSAVHAAIEDFTRKFADRLPADPLAELLALGRVRFAPLMGFPEAKALWWPRFERIAGWFADWEKGRRPNIEAVHPEVGGKLEIPAGDRTFLLTARADRIERHGEGSYAVLDYKTGQVATARQVRLGLAPQLTLEAAILAAGGFETVPAGTVDAISYVRLRGGEPPGEECEISWNNTTPAAQAAHALEKLRELVRRFENEQTPYVSLALSMWKTRYGDYDHLARVKEWSVDQEVDE